MITQEDLSQITEHIHGHFNQWISNAQISANTHNYEMEHSERLVRVEESIKNSIELTQQGFKLMEKSFEHVETRLSELSRRIFQFMIWSFGFTTTAAGVIITVLKF